MDFVAYYQNLIKIQQKDIRFWWIWVAFVFIGGAAIVISGARFASQADALRLLGGAFIATCSLVPHRWIGPKRERIVTLSQLKTYFETADISEEEKRALFLELTKKTFEEAMRRG